MTTNPIRVLLADDHSLVRAGFRSLLNNIEGVEVIAEACNGREALQLIKTHLPDIVFLDIGMPELNGLEVTERIKNENINVKIIILSMHTNEEYVLQALRVGASGYLLKDSDIAELELALKAVDKGGKYLSPAISKQVVDNYLDRVEKNHVDVDTVKSSFQQLTLRQREILQLIAEGNSTKEIAYKLGISIKTVETHRTQLMERLGINDIAGLVRYAIRIGLVSAEK